ncbi:hypothetical protein BDP81DRAFT_402200 [Colletotrichum phormii]|uniref:Uncharacterized protein n=1 Tax=Colletotrichum phormii TaxID=359342 RepID=A0AAJ0A5B2_9PEZI|nr:uncharacterized protein BDP81DRAFT_402200 [Colletotrichum phormii]KAK1656369.1 hypothetical protein BDP81DRAFT_402200 [Colletotrichum phormii]
MLSSNDEEEAMLWLYIWPCSTDPTIRNSGFEVEPVNITLPSSGTVCGALVEYCNRKATIGLVLEVDGTTRLLTVEHLFNTESLVTKSLQEQTLQNATEWAFDSDESEGSGWGSENPDISEDSESEESLGTIFKDNFNATKGLDINSQPEAWKTPTPRYSKLELFPT